jgi:hypothetical protein
MSVFFSPEPFGCFPTGRAGEDSFVRPNGLIMGAAARSLPGRRSTRLALQPRRFGLVRENTPAGWASRARKRR